MDGVFIGRQREREALGIVLEGKESTKNAVAISGPNEIGKTELYKKVRGDKSRDLLRAGRLVLDMAISLDGYDERTEEEKQQDHITFWRAVVRSFWTQYTNYCIECRTECFEQFTAPYEAVVREKSEIPSRASEDKICQILNELIEYFSENLQVRFVLGIDECDRFQGHCEDFFKVLLSLIKNEKISVVLISRRQIEHLCPESVSADFAGCFPEENRIRLNGFSAEETGEFYAEAEKGWKDRIGEGVYDRILFYCGYHPALLQRMKSAVTGWLVANGTEAIDKDQIDRLFAENKGKVKGVYDRLLELMEDDFSDEKLYTDRNETIKTSYAELFLRVFGPMHEFQYHYSKWERDNWAQKLLEAGYVYRAGSFEIGNSDLYGAMYISGDEGNVETENRVQYMSIAPYVVQYIVQRWNEKLNDLMKKLDRLELKLRELLSRKLIYRFGYRNACDNVITWFSSMNRNKVVPMMSAKVEYLVNGWKKAENEICELNALSFTDYMTIIEMCFEHQYFESLSNDDVKTYMSGWNKAELETILGMDENATDAKQWDNLTFEERRKFSVISFTRARNLAKHRNNLQMLNPGLYKGLSTFCDWMLSDIENGRALNHMKAQIDEVQSRPEETVDIPSYIDGVCRHFKVTETEGGRRRGKIIIDGAEVDGIISKAVCGAMGRLGEALDVNSDLEGYIYTRNINEAADGSMIISYSFIPKLFYDYFGEICGATQFAVLKTKGVVPDEVRSEVVIRRTSAPAVTAVTKEELTKMKEAGNRVLFYCEKAKYQNGNVTLSGQLILPDGKKTEAMINNGAQNFSEPAEKLFTAKIGKIQDDNSVLVNDLKLFDEQVVFTCTRVSNTKNNQTRFDGTVEIELEGTSESYCIKRDSFVIGNNLSGYADPEGKKFITKLRGFYKDTGVFTANRDDFCEYGDGANT